MDEDSSRAYKHRHSPHDELHEQADQTKVKVLDWDLEVREKLQRGVIVGDPGLGKTWLLKCEAARYARAAAERLHKDGALNEVILPIYLRLSDVAKALPDSINPSSLLEAVLQILKGEYSLGKPERKSRQLLLDLLRRGLQTGRCVLLLDAYDEVPAGYREKLRDALTAWMGTERQNRRVLFTSRVVGYEPPWPIPDTSEAEREMELLPFADEQIRAFLEAFFAGQPAAAAEMHDLVRRSPQLLGMAQVPLLLGFLCALYREDRDRPVGQRRDWPRQRRCDLYRDCLDRLLSGTWHDASRLMSDVKVHRKIKLLAGVAFRLFVAEKEQFSLDDLEQAIREGHAEFSKKALSDDEIDAKIEEWSERDGILVKAGAGSDPPYLFLHLTFQEYLTGRYLAEWINKHGGWDKARVPLGESRCVLARDLLDRKAWLPAWQEAIVLLAGMLDDSVPLLEMLADESKDDLFRHRLALAARCLPEIKKLLDEGKGA